MYITLAFNVGLFIVWIFTFSPGSEQQTGLEWYMMYTYVSFVCMYTYMYGHSNFKTYTVQMYLLLYMYMYM